MSNKLSMQGLLQGRISRAAFAWSLALMFALALAAGFAATLVWHPFFSIPIAVTLFILLSIAPALLRLHDTNDSGRCLWWLALPIALTWSYPIFMAVTCMVFPDNQFVIDNKVCLALGYYAIIAVPTSGIVALIGTLIAFIKLALKKGTTGLNDYGPEPITQKDIPHDA